MAHNCIGNSAETGLLELVGAPAVEFGSDLVPPDGIAGPALDDLHRVQPERKQHCLLEPLVHLPGAVLLTLGDTRLAAVEQTERGFHRIANLAACVGRNAVALVECLFNCLFQRGGIGVRHACGSIEQAVKGSAIVWEKDPGRRGNYAKRH